MKPYKRIYAIDSPDCIVLDENVKSVSLWMVLLKLAGFITLFGLTCFGLIGGVTSKFAQEKLQSLDTWSSAPENAEFLFYTGIVFLSVVLLWFVLYWLYVRLSK
jgi:hypothetical protein